MCKACFAYFGAEELKGVKNDAFSMTIINHLVKWIFLKYSSNCVMALLKYGQAALLGLLST